MRIVFEAPRVTVERVERISGTAENRLTLLKRLPYDEVVFSAAFDGILLAYGGRSGTIRLVKLVDPENPDRISSRKAHNGSVMDLIRYGDLLVSSSRDATIKFRKGSRLVRTLRGHTACVRSVAIRNDKLMSVSMDGRTLLRDLESGSYKELAKHDARVVHVRNHENVFVDVTIDGHVRVRDAESAEKLAEFELGMPAYGVAISRPMAYVSTPFGLSAIHLERLERVSDIALPTSGKYIRRPAATRSSVALGGEVLRVVDDPVGSREVYALEGHSDRIYNVIREDFAFTCSLDHTLGIRRPEFVKRVSSEKRSRGVARFAFECENPGDQKAEDRLVELFRYRPVKALKLACGRCLADLVERLESLGYIRNGVSLVPPENPEALERVERIFR